jgi:DNA polymerase-3 subunit delta
MPTPQKPTELKRKLGNPGKRPLPELAATIAEGDRLAALIQLAKLLEQGQSEIGIVSLVARHIRILLMIRQGFELNLSGQKLATFAQVPSYYLQDYVGQARLWSSKKLEMVLVILSETDKALKSSPLSSHIWLENLIFRTCSLMSSSAVTSTRPANV